MLPFCTIHNIAADVSVSTSIRDALEKDSPLKNTRQIVIIQPDEGMKRSYILVDDDVLDKVGIGEKEHVVLFDRDRKNKKLNDRLLIRKIDQQLWSVCAVCLAGKLNLKISLE